jgi:hypothetical protein
MLPKVSAWKKRMKKVEKTSRIVENKIGSMEIG